MALLADKYVNLISGRSRGALADLARVSLWLLSLAYRAVVAVRNAWYGLIPPAVRRIPGSVFAVGNITVGGTGKTPMAACLANLLLQRGLRVAIVLRGYKGGAIQFDADQRDEAIVRWRKESDEALVLKRRCPRAMVLVNPDRVAAARRAVAAGAEAVVLDDAFQHRRIARDLNIALVDATQPFGYGHLLPRGLLREPTRSLRRADLIVLTRADQIDDASRNVLIGRLQRLSAGRPVISAAHRIVGFTDVKGSDVTLNDLSAMQAVIFAGIANFESFRKTIEEVGVRVVAAYQYPDHHDYRADEIAALADVAGTLEANVLLTTEKDAVKLVGRWPDEGCRLLVAKLDIEFDSDGERVLEGMLERTLSRWSKQDSASSPGS